MCRNQIRQAGVVCLLSLLIGVTTGCSHFGAEPDEGIDGEVEAGNDSSEANSTNGGQPEDEQISQQLDASEPDDLAPAEPVAEDLKPTEPEGDAVPVPEELPAPPPIVEPLVETTAPAPAEPAAVPEPIAIKPEVHTGRFAVLTKNCDVREAPNGKILHSLPGGRRLWTESSETDWLKVYGHGTEMYVEVACFAAVAAAEPAATLATTTTAPVELTPAEQPPEQAPAAPDPTATSSATSAATTEPPPPPVDKKPENIAPAEPAVATRPVDPPPPPAPAVAEVAVNPPPALLPAADPQTAPDPSGTEKGFAAGLVAGIFIFVVYLILRRQRAQSQEQTTRTLTMA
jgi:hypothetical protein